MKSRSPKSDKPVRYAVVGLGHIAQIAVLPAFKHAPNSELIAIVSDDAEKRRELSDMYGLGHAVDYDDLEDLLESKVVDAVYIALPNHLHHEYTIRAANAGIHVLCEKPLAVTSKECEEMIAATDAAGVKLMTAYRLHFDKANLRAIEIAKSGEIGEARLFNSVFTMQVKPGNVRVDRESGGGPLYDIGVYCINAARYVFQSEPTSVLATSVSSSDPRFEEIDEAVSVVMHFPGDRLASFTCSFGAASVGQYQIVGTKGDLRVDPAFSYMGKLRHLLTVEGKTKTRSFPASDHFAPQLIYFSDCITKNRKPEPSGEEGLVDVQIIEAIHHSARLGERVELPELKDFKRPGKHQEMSKPPVREPELVNVDGPHD